MQIKFGTDGWRGIIADDFTFDNVRRCARGTVSFLQCQGLANRGLVVGYDTRFASHRFAKEVAEIAASSGIQTMLADKPCPTPAISFAVVSHNAGGGVVITASHNPPEWNGFKYKPDYGGSASTEQVSALEKHIEFPDYYHVTVPDNATGELIKSFDPMPTYLESISKLVDLDEIKQAGLTIVADSMYGSGSGCFQQLLTSGSTQVVEIRGEKNPSFPGIAQPEPIEQNLGALTYAVKERQADLGLATDGDADRLGIVDEKGRFITTLQSFALLCLHQLEVLGRRGSIVRSITTTSMVDKLGELYGVQVFDTPVGFKYLGPIMLRENALIAGEESGGYGFKGHIPERDGLVSGLMILDMMVKTGKSISELLDDLYSKVGPHYYDRLDLAFDPAFKERVEERVRYASPKTLGNRVVKQIDYRDGIRFVLEGGYWGLIRFSGTEPLLRLYAEGESPEEVKLLIDSIQNLSHQSLDG